MFLIPGMLSSLVCVVDDCIDGMGGYCGDSGILMY